MKKALKIIAIVIVSIVALIGAALAFITYQIDDERLCDNTRKYLTEVLDTKVELKSAELSPLTNTIALYGLNVKDKKNIDMLHVDTLEAKLNFWQLLHNEITVYGFNLAGAKTIIYKETKQSKPNYQFVIDSLSFIGDKNKNKVKDKENKTDKQLFVDLRKVTISRTSGTWDVLSADSLNTPDHRQLDFNHLNIKDLSLKLSLKGGGAPGSFVGTLNYLTVNEQNSKTAVAIHDIDFDAPKGEATIKELDFLYQDKHLTLGNFNLQGKKDYKHYLLNIEHIAFENGIGVPKKPVSPKHGAFDAKHVKLNLSLSATATVMTTDSLAMQINKLSGKDENSGLALDNISMSISRNHDKSAIRNLTIISGGNRIKVANVNVVLPRYGKDARPWSFTTSTVHCQSMLKDIAHAFAPVLENFNTPINCTTTIAGNHETIHFSNIKVLTPDKRLTINADGTFTLPKHKGEKISMLFNVHSLTARNGIKEQIISHFNVKDKSLEFIRNLGDITFKGTVNIPYRHQYIKGRLSTRYGSFDADVALNEDTYYLSGSVATTDFQLGKYIDNPHIGDVSLKADVTMDISSKAHAKILHRYKGKIPAGTIKGRAIEASYMGFKIHNIDFKIVSDARVAHGNLAATGKVMDVSCDFSFNDADIKNSLHVTPHIKMHNFLKDVSPKNIINSIFGNNKNKDKNNNKNKNKK